MDCPDLSEQSKILDQWSSGNIAYVKPIDDEGVTYYVVCGSDGRTLAIAPTRDLAFVVTRQHDFEPQDAH